jgi:hypothetical protein
MSTLSIVVLTVLASIFGLILLAGIAAMIWLLIRQHRLSLSLDRSNLELQSSFAKSLSDHTSTLQLLSTTISGTLETHRAKTDEQIAKINGAKLETAVQSLDQILPEISKQATRNEKVCTAFMGALQELTREQGISGSDLDRARTSGLAPESYAHASPGERWTSRSRTAESDATAIDRESADNTTTTIDATDIALDIYDQSPDE